jgi:hypothetical protein
MFASYAHKLRYLSTKQLKSSTSRDGFHYRPADKMTPSGTFDQYSAHSPLQMSRHKADELRSKLFFQTPPIPNRIPKFVLAWFFAAVVSTGMRDKQRRRYHKFAREQDRYMLRTILPFVQAMEDIRYTAIEQKNFIVLKAIADTINPAVFENVRRRYHQEDI